MNDLNNPPKAPIIKFESTSDTVILNWEPVENAVKYRVFKYNKENDNYDVLVKNLTATKFKVENLVPNSEYVFLVRAYNSKGTPSYYDETNNIITKTKSEEETKINIAYIRNEENIKYKKIKRPLNVITLFNVFSIISIGLFTFLFLINNFKNSEIKYNGECGKNTYWAFENGVLTITGIGEMNNYVKNTIPWSSIIDEINTVLIEDGVTYIGKNSFDSAINLKEVYISDDVSKIGSYAFWGCSKLGKVTYYGDEPILEYQAFFQNPVNLKFVLENEKTN